MASSVESASELAALSQFSTSLSTYVPLPFRILALLTLGIFCWALNLHILHLLGIDTSAILDIRTSTSGEHVHPSKLYPPIYQLAAFGLAWTSACWIIGLHVIAGGNVDSLAGRIVAAFSWATAVAFMVLPIDKLKRSERVMFLRSLKRSATDSIMRPVPFCDVIMADILTSYAKVLGDLWVCVCMLIGVGQADSGEGGYREYGVPFMIALPYLIRFRQCMSDFVNTPWEASTPSHAQHHGHQPSIFLAPTSAASTPASPKRRALFNAAKYLSALPVIIFSAMQGKFNDPHDHGDIVKAANASSTAFFSPQVLFRVWVLSVLVNSLYSFWWDVTNDFGLHLLLPTRITITPLRKTLLLPDPMIYYLVTALDFVLRFTWSLKLSSHLHSIHEMEMGIFILEAMEVLRRWLWVFVRIEWEAVRKGGDSLEERLRSHGSGLDLPLLGGPGSSSAGLERRISANHRKTISNKTQHDTDGSDNEMGLGRSGVLVDVPRMKN